MLRVAKQIDVSDRPNPLLAHSDITYCTPHVPFSAVNRTRLLAPWISAFDPKPTSAGLLTDAETIAPAVNAGEPARKYRRDGSALCYRYWRNSSGRCRLPRYLTGPACRIGRLGWPAHSTERLDRSSHGLAYQRLMLCRAHPQLLLPI